MKKNPASSLIEYGAVMLRFWERHPALLYGLFFYLGCHFALWPTWCCFIPIVFLLLPTISVSPSHYQRFILSLGFGCAAYFFTTASIEMPSPANQKKIFIEATVAIEDISQGYRFGTLFWKYRLKISDPSHHLHNVPCHMVWKDGSTRPLGGYQYQAAGALVPVENGVFMFTPNRDAHWKKLTHSFSCVEMRMRLKMQLKQFLRAHLPPSDARSFLEGLISGEFHDPLLAKNLSRFGLQHIMVVSGFHFSLIAAFVAFLFRFIAPWKASLIGLILAATLYLFFLGTTSSVMRAYISIMVMLVAKLFEKKANGLNSLGVGLIVILLYDPAFCQSAGFRLSFLATGAILLFYPLFDAILLKKFPQRRAPVVLSMPFIDQLLYVVLAFFRASWALIAAVHILMLPMCLYAFHTFPLMGILYNCFFPFLVSLCMTLLGIACLFFWVPSISELLFHACYLMTDAVLAYVTFAPSSFDKAISVEYFPDWAIVLYLTVACLVGIVWSMQDKEISDPLIQRF